MSAPIIIVSGLPRSGTSLMMQILEAGGFPPLTDGVRFADDDNPRGYFEWEAIKKVEQDHRVLEQAVGGDKAVKAISTLLPKLPKAHNYKVIFMERDIGEVIQSQQKMLVARGEAAQEEYPAETRKRLKAHNDQIIAWMKAAPHMDILMVSHRKLIRNPADQISRIISFLGRDKLPSAGAMTGAVDPDLYRNRNRQNMVARLGSFLLNRN